MMNPVSLILLGKFSLRIIADKLGIILQNHLLEGESVSVSSKDEVTCHEMSRYASLLPHGDLCGLQSLQSQWVLPDSLLADILLRRD